MSSGGFSASFRPGSGRREGPDTRRLIAGGGDHSPRGADGTFSDELASTSTSVGLDLSSVNSVHLPESGKLPGNSGIFATSGMSKGETKTNRVSFNPLGASAGKKDPPYNPLESSAERKDPPYTVAPSTTNSTVSYYSNRAAVDPSMDPNAVDPAAVSSSMDTADVSLDISRCSSPTGSRWSMLGGSSKLSERSWTPSNPVQAVRTRIDRIQKWHAWMNVKFFCFCICILITVHGTLATGYIMSVLTTIEKRFEIKSQTSGLIVSSYEFGSLLSVLFVSYFGQQGHIPRWVGVGGILLACGSFLFSIPHFLATYVPQLSNFSQPDFPDDAVCHGSGSDLGARKLTDPGVTVSKCVDPPSTASQYVFVLMLAEVMLGVGGTPLFTLGTTYIDNHVSKESSSVYLAFMYVSLAFGPVCGFLLGAFMVSNYVNPGGSIHVNMEDPAFIGLWWGGFIICALLYFISALPFFGFPKKLAGFNPPNGTQPDPTNQSSAQMSPVPPREKSGAAGGAPLPPSDSSAAAARDYETSSQSSYSSSLKKIPVSVFRLLTNSVYMVASLNACLDLAIVSGFTTFLAKYLETQFGQSKSMGAVLTGAVAIPGACVGTFLGGWVLKKYKLQLHGASRLVVCINVLCLCLLSVFFIFRCPNPDLTGKFTPYDRGFSVLGKLQVPNPLMEKSEVNLTDVCNSRCHCSANEYIPVCGTNGRTYFSPCFAGCESTQSETVPQESIRGTVDIVKTKLYLDCRCIPHQNQTPPAVRDDAQTLLDEAMTFANDTTTSETTPSGSTKGTTALATATYRRGGAAKPGACSSKCQMLVPFLLGVFVIALVASNNQMPLVMVTLRAVAEDEKAFALGLQVVMLRLLSYIPAPILFGAVIDTTCLVWKPTACGEEGTTCLLYDIESYTTRFGAIVVVLKIGAASLSVILWWCIKQRGQGAEPFSAPITMTEIVHRLGDAENLHIRGCEPHALRSWMSDDSLYSRPRSPRKKHQKTMSC